VSRAGNFNIVGGLGSAGEYLADQPSALSTPPRVGPREANDVDVRCDEVVLPTAIPEQRERLAVWAPTIGLTDERATAGGAQPRQVGATQESSAGIANLPLQAVRRNTTVVTVEPHPCLVRRLRPTIGESPPVRGDVGAWPTGGKAGDQVQVVDAHETLVQRGVQDTDRRVAPKPWHEIRQRAYGSREAKPVDSHDVFRGQIPPVELHSVVLVPLVSAGKYDVDRLWVGAPAIPMSRAAVPKPSTALGPWRRSAA